VREGEESGGLEKGKRKSWLIRQQKRRQTGLARQVIEE